MSMSIMAGKGSARAWRAGGVAHWLGLAASPTFALMAWSSTGDTTRIPTCAPASGLLPIDGMTWMYLLMCLFHLSSWLNLVFGRSQPLEHSTFRIEGD